MVAARQSMSTATSGGAVPGRRHGRSMAIVSVRYIVHNVDWQFAMLLRGDLRLTLSPPGGGP